MSGASQGGPRKPSTRGSSASATPATPPHSDELQRLVKATGGPVDSAESAKAHLIQASWLLEGEAVTDRKLAHILLAHRCFTREDPYPRRQRYQSNWLHSSGLT